MTRPPEGDARQRAEAAEAVEAAEATEAVEVAEATEAAGAAEAVEAAEAADVLPLAPPPAISRGPAVLVAGAAGLAFALLAVWVAERGAAVPVIDESIHRWVVAHRDPVSVTIANDLRWGGITRVVLPVLVPVGVLAAAPGSGWSRRVRSGLILCAIAGAGIGVETQVNHLIGRARPPISDWAGAASGPSFPSGHTTVATLFALSCAWACAGRVRAGWPRRAIWAGAAVYAGAVGWSRVWLGVHWPTDVVAGWLFGLAWLAASTALILTLRRVPVPRVILRRAPGRRR